MDRDGNLALVAALRIGIGRSRLSASGDSRGAAVRGFQELDAEALEEANMEEADLEDDDADADDVPTMTVPGIRLRPQNALIRPIQVPAKDRMVKAADGCLGGSAAGLSSAAR